MDVIIQSIDFTAREDLKEFITKKLDSLGEKYSEAIRANVRLKFDRNKPGENKTCEIRLEIPGNDLYASRQEISFEEATQQVIAALKKQIDKLGTQDHQR